MIILVWILMMTLEQVETESLSEHKTIKEIKHPEIPNKQSENIIIICC